MGNAPASVYSELLLHFCFLKQLHLCAPKFVEQFFMDGDWACFQPWARYKQRHSAVPVLVLLAYVLLNLQDEFLDGGLLGYRGYAFNVEKCFH